MSKTNLSIKKPTEKAHNEKKQASIKALEGIKRLNVNIPTKLHQKLKQCALDNQTNVTSIIIEAAENYLAKQSRF